MTFQDTKSYFKVNNLRISLAGATAAVIFLIKIYHLAFAYFRVRFNYRKMFGNKVKAVHKDQAN